jgi:transcriptional regulator with XRE-family HTH domain
VETKAEIREFLTSRRGRITPEQAGLPTYGARRVPGLRREEVAVLAGVSIQYYTRLERGDMSGASESVLEALARALQLDDAERAHLFDLARAAQPDGARPRRRQPKPRIRPEIQWTLDAITGAAAYLGNDRLEILATNQLGRALFCELYATPTRPANHARFVFLDPRAETFYTDWDRAARETARSCARPPAATPTTATSQISSANSRRRAKRSAPIGQRTTCVSTLPRSSTSSTQSSASSASASTASTSPQTTASRSSPTPPNPAPTPSRR